ncbi:MAG: hypothetical protein ACK442_13625 [Novosphingobium sp.]|jgi:hypothetical protein|nr:hypothetical protein [Brevundimonas sp.]MCZ8320660.1 hypothetical protein [Novosphingobium sp.]
MSKQLALSIAASVLAMAGYVVLAGGSAHGGLDRDGPRWSAQAETPGLPAIGQLIPVLQ